jgi:hypothetical protein
MNSETVIKIIKSEKSFSILRDDECIALGTFDGRGVPIIGGKNEIEQKLDDENVFALLELA